MTLKSKKTQSHEGTKQLSRATCLVGTCLALLSRSLRTRTEIRTGHSFPVAICLGFLRSLGRSLFPFPRSFLLLGLYFLNGARFAGFFFAVPFPRLGFGVVDFLAAFPFVAGFWPFDLAADFFAGAFWVAEAFSEAGFFEPFPSGLFAVFLFSSSGSGCPGSFFSIGRFGYPGSLTLWDGAFFAISTVLLCQGRFLLVNIAHAH